MTNSKTLIAVLVVVALPLSRSSPFPSAERQQFSARPAGRWSNGSSSSHYRDIR
jgi:hypothetical protein